VHVAAERSRARQVDADQLVVEQDAKPLDQLVEVRR
jgi:hypothetical protein